MDIKLVIGIASPMITTLLAFLLNKYMNNKPKIVAYITSLIEHRDLIQGENGQPQEIPLRLHLLVVRNEGKIVAKNVSVSHLKPPENGNITWSISPSSVIFNHQTAPDGSDIFIFPTLVPGEEINISYRYFAPTTINHIHSTIKSDEGFAKILNFVPTQKLPRWKKNSLLALAFIGAWSTIYWLAIIIICLFNSLSCFN